MKTLFEIAQEKKLKQSAKISASYQEVKIEPSFINAPEQRQSINLTIDLVANKNRIDLFFDQKPSQNTILKLKDECWQWNPERKCWYNKDTSSNRDFLRAYFYAEIDSSNYTEDSKVQSEIVIGADQVDRVEVKNEMQESAKVNKSMLDNLETDLHCKQVKALCDLYSMQPGELMQYLVNKVYNQEFSI